MTQPVERLMAHDGDVELFYGQLSGGERGTCACGLPLILIALAKSGEYECRERSTFRPECQQCNIWRNPEAVPMRDYPLVHLR